MSLPGSYGYVYVLRMGDYFKIGISKNVKNRMHDLSTALPEESQLVLIIPSMDARLVERNIHRALSQYRTRGEWFRVDEKTVRKIVGR